MRLLSIAVMMALVAPVRADDPPGSDRPKAEQHFRIGEKAYRAQNFAAASEQFDLAYQSLPLPEIAFSAAQAYRRRYRTDPQLEYAQRAVELYEVYLEKVKQGGRVRDASDSLGEMQREVAKLVAAGAKARAKDPVAVAERKTRIVIDPDLLAESGTTIGAIGEISDFADDRGVKLVVTLDGKPVPPYESIEVEPRAYKIRVEAEGYLPVERIETATKGESTPVKITLKPKPARIALVTEDDARVRVDGRLVGAAPLAPFDLPAGRHVITIARSGREPIAREIVVTRGQSLAMREPLEKTTRRKAVPWVAGAAGTLAVFAGVSTVAAIVVDGRAADQRTLIEAGDQPDSALTRYDSLVRRRDQLVVGAWVAGGAALAVSGLALALYFGDHPSAENVRVTPFASSAGTGVAAIGRF